MHTGDLAVMRDDGYCMVIGRIKDMVIRGGENVYPREVEEFLHTHPDIDDAQVIGVPDEKYGEDLRVDQDAGGPGTPGCQTPCGRSHPESSRTTRFPGMSASSTSSR